MDDLYRLAFPLKVLKSFGMPEAVDLEFNYKWDNMILLRHGCSLKVRTRDNLRQGVVYFRTDALRFRLDSDFNIRDVPYVIDGEVMYVYVG